MLLNIKIQKFVNSVRQLADTNRVKFIIKKHGKRTNIFGNKNCINFRK